MTLRAKILGTGGYVPPEVVKNDDLKAFMDTNDEWIHSRTGIRERRYAAVGVTTSDLAVEAARRALEAAAMEAKDLECIILGTLSPDFFFPGTAVFMQDKLGIAEGSCPCYDIRQQCSAFVYGTEMARAFIEAGLYRTVLLVGTEIHSHGLDFSTRGRGVTALFGDGAGAVIYGATETDRPDDGVFYTETHADGRGALDGVHMKVFDMRRKPFVDYDVLDFDQNLDLWPQMPNPRNLFVNGVVRMSEITLKALEETGHTVDDLDWMLPHQANIHMIEDSARRIGLPREKVLVNIDRYGNTTAATIPLLLDEHIRNGQIQRGQLLVYVAFGSGFTWGVSLVRY